MEKRRYCFICKLANQKGKNQMHTTSFSSLALCTCILASCLILRAFGDEKDTGASPAERSAADRYRDLQQKRQDRVVESFLRSTQGDKAAIAKIVRSLRAKLPKLYLDPYKLESGQMGVLAIEAPSKRERDTLYTIRIKEVLGKDEAIVAIESDGEDLPIKIRGFSTEAFSVGELARITDRHVFEAISPGVLQAVGQSPRPAVAKKDDFRIWTSGKHTVEARFAGSVGGKVTLERRDGKKVRIEIDRLSAADRSFITGRAGGARAKPKKEDADKPKRVETDGKEVRRTKADREAARLETQKAAFRKNLAKQWTNQGDGYVVLALEEVVLADKKVAVTINVSRGRKSAADTLADFWFNGKATRRSYQVLAWYDGSAKSKRTAEAHQKKLDGFLKNRSKDKEFSLEPCYSDLLPSATRSINQGIAEGTVIRYVPFANASP